MRKIITLAIAIFALSLAHAQSDTIVKKDTVVVYVFQVTDTIQVPTLLYEGKNNRVYKASPGYYVVQRQLATIDFKNYQDVRQPTVLEALDERKRKVKAITN